MIRFIETLPIGNALRVFLAPPENAKTWRLLRRRDDQFAGFDDPAAILVFAGTDNVILDDAALTNGTRYYYRAYYSDGSVWRASDITQASPQATYQDQSVDVLTLLRERLSAGLEVEVARATLKPKSGRIPVQNAPPLFEETAWPVVTLHLLKDAQSEHVIGSEIVPDDYIDGAWAESEGTLNRWQITVAGCSLNPDERILLRQALRRIVIGNLPVFAAHGVSEVQFDLEDADEISRFPAPVYQAMGSFSCLAPAYVTDSVDAITDIDLIVNGETYE